MASKKKTAKKAQPKPKKAKSAARNLSVSPSGTSSKDNGSDQQLVLVFPGTITPMALLLNPVLEYDEWSVVGAQLRRVKEFIQFAIGDWLNYGEQHYGEMYAQAASETGLPEETLMVLKSISSRVTPETRIKELTWSHHREVAKFPPEEQTRWLEMALKKHWSVRDLKDALKKAAGKDDGQQGDGQQGDGKEGGDRKEDPPTGEACTCCGGSPATLRICAKCLILPAKALDTIGIEGAIEVQLSMLKWAFEYVKQPPEQSPQEVIEWEARYEALQKVVAKAA